MAANPNPTSFESREASELYSRAQWDSALKVTPHSPKVIFGTSGAQSQLRVDCPRLPLSPSSLTADNAQLLPD